MKVYFTRVITYKSCFCFTSKRCISASKLRTIKYVNFARVHWFYFYEMRRESDVGSMSGGEYAVFPVQPRLAHARQDYYIFFGVHSSRYTKFEILSALVCKRTILSYKMISPRLSPPARPAASTRSVVTQGACRPLARSACAMHNPYNILLCMALRLSSSTLLRSIDRMLSFQCCTYSHFF